MYQKAAFYFLFLSLFGFSLQVSQAQEYTYTVGMRKVDSLKKALETRNDSNRFDVLWDLAYELVDVDNPQAFQYARQSHDYALAKNDSLAIVKSGRIMGQILRRLDQLDEAINVFSEVLPISLRHQYNHETKIILNSLAIAYTFKAQYDKALEYHFQSLIIREKEGDKKEISISLNNIGLVYFKLANHDLALHYYLQALQAKNEVNDTYDLDRLLLNIGLCYNSLSDYKMATDYFNQAFAVCANDCNKQIIIEGEYGLGSSYAMQKNYNEAERHFKKSLELSIQENNGRFQLEDLIELTKIYLQMKNLPAADRYRNRAVQLAEKSEYRELLMNVYKLNADYFALSNDYGNANDFLRRYSELKDSIFDARVIKNLTAIQTQYAQRENLAIIASKDQVLVLKEKVITQQSILAWLLGAVIVLISALGVVIYRNYKGIKTVNAALASAKQVIEEQNLLLDRQVQDKTRELLETNASLVKVNYELDHFIYKTSHDIRGPLASLKGMVNLAIMDVKDEKALNYLSRLDLTAEKLNVVLSRLLIVNRINKAELKPEAVFFEPLIQDILAFEMKKGVPDKVRIDYNVAPDVQLISDKEMVRLVLENLIDNAIKYYNDSERVDSFVKITVGIEEGKVAVRVQDNGVGIPPQDRENIFQMFVRASERSETGGIGLYLAKQATEKLGGTIRLDSTDIKFTEFVVHFPRNLERLQSVEKQREEKERLGVK